MATANLDTIFALQKTIDRLKGDSNYMWGHMGACNCGHLAQSVTNLTKAEIHQFAMERMGDWNDQIHDFCPDSGLPIDFIIKTMIEIGFTANDLKNLENLSDETILNNLAGGKRHLNRNNKSDLIAYLTAWLKILQNNWYESEMHARIQPIAHQNVTTI